MINITLKQKEIAYGNKSLYLDIYENGKHKKEFLSLYLLPEIDEQTRDRNRKTLEKAWQTLRWRGSQHGVYLACRFHSRSKKEIISKNDETV